MTDAPQTPTHSSPTEQEMVTMRWTHIETALRYLTVPEKAHLITETMEAIRKLDTNNPEKMAFTLISACAWLTDETPPLEPVVN